MTLTSVLIVEDEESLADPLAFLLRKEGFEATVVADGYTTLLEIRWQGLRDLMRRTPAIREHIEQAYRENSLRVHLRETPLLKDLPEAALDEVATATMFESYGNFDWYSDFGAKRNGDAA